MPRKIKRRRYDASGRRALANATRVKILTAARNLFVARGYLATKMGDIATQAGVALDTVYASIGAKPKLFRLLVETAISGANRAIPTERRQYVRDIKAEPDPGRKLELYAAAVGDIQARLAPLVAVLQSAAPTRKDLKALWRQISDRRVRSMRRLVEHLEATGKLRPGISHDEAADVLWAMNSPEVYLLLVGQRGWSPEKYRAWFTGSCRRYLLKA